MKSKIRPQRTTEKTQGATEMVTLFSKRHFIAGYFSVALCVFSAALCDQNLFAQQKIKLIFTRFNKTFASAYFSVALCVFSAALCGQNLFAQQKIKLIFTRFNKTFASAYFSVALCVFSVALCTQNLFAQQKIIVSKTGKADFHSIQGAINSLSDSSATPRIIFIKQGVYKEKLYIEKSNIIFEGENRQNTIITQAIARDEWRCGHMDDWGVATMNVGANDITLKNLTIVNSYGFDWKRDVIVNCPSDTLTKQKTITKNGHQMALRTMNATRLRAVNCHFRAFAGDTVSPWDVENGMWYFKDCIMEGGVDFYCPRGWAWAENCEFITNTGSAAIWHDGSRHEDSKTVLLNCRFSGYEGFLLGRYHRDAQFYLVNCVFADNMKDSAIYLVPTVNTIRWGHRVYYYDCHRKGGNDFAWFKNNLPAGVNAADITVEWVFKNKWKPSQ